MENKHSQSIPQEKIDEALGLVDQAYNILSSYLLSLTDDERQTIPKMGNKTLSFVEKTGKLAALNPQYCPSFFNLEDFRIDLNDALALGGIISRAKQLERALEDTQMVSGSEAYVQAGVVYQNIKLAAKKNQPGAKVLYDELRQSHPSAK